MGKVMNALNGRRGIFISFVTAVFCMLCMTAPAYSAVIAWYDIYANTTTQGQTSLPAEPPSLDVTVSSITFAGTVAQASSSTWYDGNFGGGLGGSFCARNFTTGGTPALTDYFQMVITPGASSTMTFTNVTFALAREYDVPGNYIGPSNFEVRYSTDGTNFNTFAGNTGTLPASDLQQVQFNFSLASLPANIATPVYFRLYPYGDGVGVICFAFTTSTHYSGTGANVYFNGTVTTASAEMNVMGNSVSIVDGDATPSLTDHTDFGSVDVSGNIIRTFTIENTGGASLNLTGSSPYVSISGANAADFSVTSIPSSTITTGGTTTFDITFTPSAAGTRSASLSIANNDSDENPYDFSIQGTGTIPAAPEMDVQGNSTSIVDGDTTPSTVDHTDFGDADVSNDIILRTYTIENTGTAVLNITGPVTIGGSHAADFSVVSPPDSTVAAGSGTTEFIISFNPSATGIRSATLSIDNDDSDENPYNFSIQGNGTILNTPDINVTGNGISIVHGDVTPSLTDYTDFGSADVTSEAAIRTFMIQNTGTAALNLTDVSPYVAIGGAHAADFLVSLIPVTPVPSGSSTTLEVTFDPSATGARSATISIASDDPDENPYTFVIQGTGTTVVAPEMDVQGNGVSIADGDVTPDSADHTDFGNADITSGTVVRTFTIENTGTGTLNLTGSSPYVVIGGTDAADFSVTVIPASSISASGGTTTFEITFDPSATGIRLATISIGNDDTDENPYDFAVMGTGTIPVAPEIDVQGNGVSIADGDITPSAADHTDFGSAGVSSGSITRTFTIENTGTGTLNLTAPPPYVFITGTNAADFSVSAAPAGFVSAGGTTTFDITFDPGEAGTRSAMINILNDDSDEDQYTFFVQGTGTLPAVPEINVKGNSVSIAHGDATPSATDHTDFGSADVTSGTVVRTFTIENTGTGTLTLTGSSPYVSISGPGASDFSVTSAPGSTITAGGGNTTFDITFDPAASGTSFAMVNIASDDSDENPYTFAVQGTGTVSVEPEIDVQGNSTSIADGDTTPSSDDHTDFGGVDVDSGMITRTFTIENTGTGTLTLTGTTPFVTISGTHASDFTVTAAPESTIVSGGTTTFEITFDPGASGVRSATVSIANDDSTEDPYDFNIQGTGTLPVVNTAPTAPVLIDPADGAVDVTLPVAFRWNAADDDDGDSLAYELYICDNDTFTGCDAPVNTVAMNDQYTGPRLYFAGAGAGLIALGFVFGMIRRRRITMLIMTLAVLMGLLLTSCGDTDTKYVPYYDSTDYAVPVHDLMPDQVYYWKVVATDGTDDTPSSVWTFRTMQ